MEATKTIYLSLGSNVGERGLNIDHALSRLADAGVRITRLSSLYRTEPVDAPPQQWFINCAVEAETALMPKQLLRVIREIEHELGRKRTVARGPRTIDIDILLYGGSLISTGELEIPHPRMAERRFVLVPLAEIAPAVRHPVFHRSAEELLAMTADRSQVVRLTAAQAREN